MLNDHVKIKLKCYIAAMLTVVLVFLVFNSLIKLQHQKYQSDEFLASAAYGNLLRAEVDRELNSLLFISNGIASYISVYQDELKPAKLKAMLKDLWHRAKHVRNLGIAIGYKVTYVYPEKNNNKILGVDYRDISEQWTEVKQAVDTRKGVLQGPIPLIQGGHGIVYRYPIFIDNQYWGIISTVIDTDTFLEAAFRNTTKKNHAFAIRIADKKQVFFGDPALFSDRETFRQISLVPDGQWEWAIKTPASHFHTQILVFQILSIIISLLIGLLVFFFLKERYRLSEYAMLDSLTRLPNRRLLNDRMDVAFYAAKRFKKRMAIMAIDVDYFKKINDTYGHDFGDEVLRDVADAISATLRDEDTVSRVGGDEFIVLLKEVHSAKNVTYIAEKLKTTFSKPMTVFGQEILVQLSIGIAIFHPDHHSALKQLCKEADVALYQAKANGRNCYSVFGESIN